MLFSKCQEGDTKRGGYWVTRLLLLFSSSRGSSWHSNRLGFLSYTKTRSGGHRQRRLHCGSCSDSHTVYLRTEKIERLVMRWLCCLSVNSKASEHGYPVSTILMRSAIDCWTEQGRKVWTVVMPSYAGVNVMRVFLGRKRNEIAHSKFNRLLGVLQIE